MGSGGLLYFAEEMECWLERHGVAPEPERNVRTIVALYRAIARADAAAVAALLADDARLEIYGAAGPERAHARGRDAFAARAICQLGRRDVAAWILERICAEGDSVVVIARERCRSTSAEPLHDVQTTLHHLVRCGRVVCFRAREFPARP